MLFQLLLRSSTYVFSGDLKPAPGLCPGPHIPAVTPGPMLGVKWGHAFLAGLQQGVYLAHGKHDVSIRCCSLLFVWLLSFSFNLLVTWTEFLILIIHAFQE